MNSGQNVWTFCHNLPHAQTLKNFLRYSVNVGVQSGQSRSLPVRAWISPTLTSRHHQSALAPSCLSFPHPLILLHNGCRLFLYQSQLTQSCNFRHEKLTLVVFFCLLGTHCLSLYAIQGLCGHYFIQPVTNLKCLHIITESKRWNVQVISMINASLSPGNANSFFTSWEPVITNS